MRNNSRALWVIWTMVPICFSPGKLLADPAIRPKSDSGGKDKEKTEAEITLVERLPTIEERGAGVLWPGEDRLCSVLVEFTVERYSSLNDKLKITRSQTSVIMQLSVLVDCGQNNPACGELGLGGERGINRPIEPTTVRFSVQEFNRFIELINDLRRINAAAPIHSSDYEFERPRVMVTLPKSEVQVVRFLPTDGSSKTGQCEITWPGLYNPFIKRQNWYPIDLDRFIELLNVVKENCNPDKRSAIPRE